MSQIEDADFDSYWEDQSRNRNRNRIRVGRQYQATVPPLLKPGETDGRCCEDLETLKWKPDNDLSDQQIDQYLSMASRAVSLFARAIDTCQNTGNGPDRTLQTALRGLSDFVTSHHPCHHDAGCQVPSPACCGDHNCKHSVANGWTPAEAHLFAQALEACGKNFGAIKKDYLPWKPVRSIIEFYYQGKDEKLGTQSSRQSEETNSSIELMTLKESTSQAKAPKQEEKETDDESIDKAEEENCNKVENIKLKCEENIIDTEINSKESLSKLNQPKNETMSSKLGSLSFFLGGQLVLKLNAQQESGSENQNFQWVLSQDTPKLPSNRKSRKSKKCCKQGSVTSLMKDHSHQTQCENKLDFNLESRDEGSGVKKAKLKSDCPHSSSPVEDINDFCNMSWMPHMEPKKERTEKCDDSPFRTENWCQSFSSLCLTQCKNENCNHKEKNCVKNSGIIPDNRDMTSTVKTEPTLSPSYMLHSAVSPKEEDTKVSVKPYLKSNRTIDMKHGNRMAACTFSNQNTFPHSPLHETSTSTSVSGMSSSTSGLSSPHSWFEHHGMWKNSKISEVPSISKKESWSSGIKLQDFVDGTPLDLSTKTSPGCQLSSKPCEMQITNKCSAVHSPGISDVQPSHFCKSSTCQKQINVKSSVSSASKETPSPNTLSHTSLAFDAWNGQISHGLPFVKTDTIRKDFHNSQLLNKNYPLGCGYSRYGMTVAYAPTVFPPIYNCKKDHTKKDKPVNLSKRSKTFECDENSSMRELEVDERCSESDMDLLPWVVTPLISYGQLHSPYCSCCIAYTDTTNINRPSDQLQGNCETPLDLSSSSNAVDKTDFQKTKNSESVAE